MKTHVNTRVPTGVFNLTCKKEPSSNGLTPPHEFHIFLRHHQCVTSQSSDKEAETIYVIKKLL